MYLFDVFIYLFYLDRKEISITTAIPIMSCEQKVKKNKKTSMIRNRMMRVKNKTIQNSCNCRRKNDDLYKGKTFLVASPNFYVTLPLLISHVLRN